MDIDWNHELAEQLDWHWPTGPTEGPYADAPVAQLVLHINREVLHHGAELALLRDLYRWKA
jgi:hypothetical protein